MSQRIDAHQHFWRPERGDYGWMNAEAALEPLRRPFMPHDYQRLRSAHRIAKTVLVQAAPTVAETEYMLGLADATDFVAKVVGWINFEDETEAATLERLARHPKFAGVRPMIQDIADPEWMHRADVQWAYRALQALDLTFDALGFPRHLAPFLRLFTRYPRLRVVVDHGMKPAIVAGDFDTWAKGIARIARETPAYCKLSGLVTEAGSDWTLDRLRPYVAHLLAEFGPRRLMWGSDWPVVNLAGGFETWAEAAQALVSAGPETDRIFGTTAAEFYRIGR